MFFGGVIVARHMRAQIGESLRCDFHGDDSKLRLIIVCVLQVTVRIVQTTSRHNSRQ